MPRPPELTAESLAAKLVGDVLNVVLLMEAGDHATAELAIFDLVDQRAALMAACAMISAEKAVSPAELARRALPAARALLKGHGTRSGYIAHGQRGEDPCLPCRAAQASYDRRRYRARKAEQATGTGATS